jgi:hypothetical protein
MEKKVIMIEESLYEFAKRGRPRKNGPKLAKQGIDAPDSWEAPEDEEEVPIEDLEVDTTDMETADEIEMPEDVFDDALLKALSNEIKVLEPNRRIVKFRLKNEMRKIIYGVPMAKLAGNAFLFKLKDGALKKVFLRDMVLEHQKSNRAKMVSEYFIDPHEDRNWVSFTGTSDEPEELELPDEKDHECWKYVSKEGKCQVCGKQYRLNRHTRTWQPK